MSAEEPKPGAEPQSATDYYENLIAALKSGRDLLLLRRHAPVAPSTQKIVEWKQAVERADRAQEFLNSDFWKEDAEPFLRKAAALRPWRPGEPTSNEDILNIYMARSGKTILLEEFVKQLFAWIREGEEAQRALERETRRQQAAREAEKRADAAR